MRKDVKLGLGVGGALAAVAVLYLAVSPSKNKGAVELAEDTSGQTALKSTDSPHNPPQPARTGNPTPDHSAVPTTKPVLPPADETGGSFPDPREHLVTNTVWNTILTERPHSTRTPERDPLPPGGRTLDEEPPIVHRGDHNTPEGRTGEGGPGHDASAPTTRPGAQQYRIKSGDNFWTIAREHYGNSSFFAYIKRANPNLNPDRLKIGDLITLPDVKDVVSSPISTDRPITPVSHETPATRPVDGALQYTVKSGDSLYAISKRLYGNYSSADRIYQLNKLQIGPDPAALKVNMVLRLPAVPNKPQ